MGRDGYYWSVDDCCWLPSPSTVAPEQASSPEQPVVTEVETA